MNSRNEFCEHERPGIALFGRRLHETFDGNRAADQKQVRQPPSSKGSLKEGFVNLSSLLPALSIGRAAVHMSADALNYLKYH
jgi:hypothetical protein